MLPGVIEDLLAKRIARHSAGAVVVFEEDSYPDTVNDERDKKLAKYFFIYRE